MPIDPTRPEQVGPALLDYLAAHLDAADLRFAEPLEAITRGWETHIYCFRLAGEGLDPAWARPLVLRIYASADQGGKAEREAAVQRFCAERGYPAPRPLAVETDLSALGLPFMIMERAPGVPMLERMARNPVAALRLAAAMADLHIALHRLPVDGFPTQAEGPLVEREIAHARQEIERLGLKELDEPMRWLEAHKEMVLPEEPSVLHNDFHPLNIIVDEDDRMTVIDWPDASVGDRHHDIASTLVLIRTAPVDPSSLRERVMTRFARGLLLRRYLGRYAQQLPIDRERLRYWEASRALNRWGLSLVLLDPELSSDHKPDTAERVPAAHQAALAERYFRQRARG